MRGVPQQLQHAGLIHFEMTTEVYNCCSSRCPYQWISQQLMVVEQRFKSLNTLPGTGEYVCNIRVGVR